MRFHIVPSNAEAFCLTTTRPDLPPFELKAEDYNWVLSLISRGLSQDVRLDIAQDVFEALLLRSIGREHVPGRIIDFVARHRRAVGNPQYNYSLDEPLTEDGKLTRLDTLSYARWKDEAD